MQQKQKFGTILFIILFSYFLILMDNSIIFTSTVKIANDLHLNEAALSWVSNAYTITFGGFLLLAGRLGDLLGRKRIFLTGLLLFGLSSLFIGLSHSMFEIISWRAIQGIGSAIIAPTSLAILMDNYEGSMRMRAISYYGATAGIGSSAGLLIGGWLTSAISWRAGFLLNVPFALFLIILTFIKIKNGKAQRIKIDYLGAILSVLIATSFVYGITITNLWLITFSIILLLGFIFWEKTQKNPLMPLELFSNRVRSGSYLARFIFMMAMLPYWFILPQIMQEIYHFTPLQSGMGFLPLTIVNFVAALYLPKLTARIGNSKVMLVGQGILLLGLILSAVLSPKLGYFLAIGLPMILVGLGQGWLLAPLTSAGVQEIPNELSGAASGMTNTMHQIGGPVGLSLVVFITSPFQNQSLVYYHWVMGLVTAFIVLGFVVLLITQPHKQVAER